MALSHWIGHWLKNGDGRCRADAAEDIRECLSCNDHCQNDIFLRKLRLRLVRIGNHSDASLFLIAVSCRERSQWLSNDLCGPDKGSQPSLRDYVCRRRCQFVGGVGERLRLLGPNGAGKSTTIKMLTGILAPSSGTVYVLGMNPWMASEALEIKRRIGVVPEGLSLFDNLTAREYLTFMGRMFLMPRDTIRQRTEDLLGVLSLEDVDKKLTIEYSHGMKKKLALVGALLPNPDLLFLDEPFEGVDAVTSKVIRDLLINYAARGSTVFITSHVLEIVERICTHVGIIVKGKLVEQTSLAELGAGGSFEQRFLERVGKLDSEGQHLSWLDDSQSQAGPS
jgi:ABC-2 type transport system ATP-binding protein